jgi:hypothetical protein
MRRVLFISLLAFGVLGCGPSQSQLTRRASFDLSCPETQLQVTKIDKSTRGVRGCGQQATYVKSCSVDPSCTWLLDSDAR